MSLGWRQYRRDMNGSRVAPFEPPNLQDDSAKGWLEGYEAIRDELDPALFAKCINSIPGDEARVILAEWWDAEDERDGWLEEAADNPSKATFAQAKADAVMSAAKARYDAHRIELAEALIKHNELGGKISKAHLPEIKKLDEDGMLSRLSGIDIQAIESFPASFGYSRTSRDNERENWARKDAWKKQATKVDVSREVQKAPSRSMSAQLRAQAAQKVVTKQSQQQHDPNGPKDLASGLAEVQEFLAQKAQKAADARSGKYMGPSFTMGLDEEGLQR